MATAPSIIVIGIGNPQRGDDGIGPLIVSHLHARHPALARCMIVRQLLPEMIPEVENAEVIVFVDAAVDCPIATIEWGQIKPDQRFSAVGHLLEPTQFLALLKLCSPQVPQAWCLRVGIEQCQPGSTISDTVAALVPDAVKQLSRFLLTIPQLVPHA